MSKENLQAAGNVLIDELVLINHELKEIDVSNFLVEINIYEDIYSNTIYGDVILADSVNITNKYKIFGDEHLRVKVRTPTYKDAISKTFKVYSLTNKVTSDDREQVFVLHFTSIEAVKDSTTRIGKAFEGTPSSIVQSIFANYLKSPKDIVNGKGKGNPALNIASQTKNKLKFVSPNWSPLKCINWLARRSVPATGKAPNFLFFETNKKFVYSSIEDLILSQRKANSVYQDYYYYKSNVDPSMNGAPIKQGDKDVVDRNYRTVTKILFKEPFNMLKATEEGYLASKLFTHDITRKTYGALAYDHIEKYKDYQHLEDYEIVNKKMADKKQDKKPFYTKFARNPDSYTTFYPKSWNLFDNQPNNNVEQWLQPRHSLMLEMSNVKLNIEVPGRTDIEAGVVVKFNYPNIGSKPTAANASDLWDKYYTGLYLVSAIHHCITLQSHRMVLEIVKDSLGQKLE